MHVYLYTCYPKSCTTLESSRSDCRTPSWRLAIENLGLRVSDHFVNGISCGGHNLVFEIWGYTVGVEVSGWAVEIRAFPHHHMDHQNKLRKLRATPLTPHLPSPRTNWSKHHSQIPHCATNLAANVSQKSRNICWSTFPGRICRSPLQYGRASSSTVWTYHSETQQRL